MEDELQHVTKFVLSVWMVPWCLRAPLTLM